MKLLNFTLEALKKNNATPNTEMISINHRTIAPCILVLLTLCALAPVKARADKVDAYIRAQMQSRHIPGLALAVVRNGKLVKARGYGLASVEFNVPATPETVFEIGSVSKQITAAAIMLLVEEGKLSLDDPIGKYISGTPEAWAPITIRHLLTHTSGLKNYTGLKGFELTERLKADDFTRLIAAHPLNFRPGDSFSYGNTNYSFLGYIIERVTGGSYWDFVTARIFKPLGMRSTRDRDPRYVIPLRANGYEWEDGTLVGRDYDLTDVFSAGAIVSTVLDLARWDAALDSEQLLKKSSLEQVWTPVRFNNGQTFPYGLGWYIETLRNHPVRRHNGQTAGFAASIARYIDDRLTVIVLCNLGDIGLAGRVGQGVAKLYVPALSLRTLKELPDPDAATTRMLRDLTDARLAGKIDSDKFADDARSSLSGASARTLWRRLASFGPLNAFTLVERLPDETRRTLRYRASLGDHLALIKFVLTPDGRIAEMSVEEEE